MPVWVDIPGDAKLPGGIERVMLTHDTGAAIRGVVRGDVFWGEGALAEARAGAMRHEGAMYVLVPRQ
jgi:membrane-bound lytic murein transglycosylase A